MGLLNTIYRVLERTIQNSENKSLILELNLLIVVAS
jgi:hypothetical protein